MFRHTSHRPLRAKPTGARAPSPFLSRRGVAVAVGALAMWWFIPTCQGQEKEKSERRAELLEQMRDLAEQTKVQRAKGERRFELTKEPVFRYDDQPRRIIDGTMWVWTHEGRPVAFQKIEAIHNARSDAAEWCHCLTSVSADLLLVEWSKAPPFRATEPGSAFRPVPDAPPVAEGSVKRRRQARELARAFTAKTFLDADKKMSEELRLLTTPIFEHAEPKTKEFQGAVFGFATNGTNCGLLLLLEPRGEGDRLVWHFSPARLSADGVTLAYRDKKLWEVPIWNETSFSNWRFFVSPRTPVTAP